MPNAKSITDQLKDAVAAKIGRMTVQELVDFLEFPKESDTGVRSLPGRDSEVRPIKQADPPSAIETEDLLASIIELLGKYTSGLRADTIRAKLGVSKPNLAKAIKLGVDSDQIEKRGERRGMTYSLPKDKPKYPPIRRSPT